MSGFCLLSEPDGYLAQDQDLIRDEAGRAYWLDLYGRQFEQTLAHAGEQHGRPAGKRIEAAREQLNSTIERLRTQPASLPGGKLNGLALCRMREDILRQHGLGDPYRLVKQRANAQAAALYPGMVRKLHLMEAEPKWLRLVQCVFAGNLFDLGGDALPQIAQDDFAAAMQRVGPRPWLIDDFDALLDGLLSGPPMPWTKAVFFVDNAGSDFILGVMPMVRELAMAGTLVVVAANEQPSLNDITADEAIEAIEHLATEDRDLAALIGGGMLEVVSTGSDIPLIDLSEVSGELNEAAADADLVVIEGMGRCIESNFGAAFRTDALRLALLKDPRVAAGIGGEVGDCVCKFTAAPS